jgi:2',3'-cyclic-nucleotide 2'-phosphodiesterase (5'-nucleotidase family)
LDAGDLLFKKYSAPIPNDGEEETLQKAYLIVDSFNLMGYDAMGVGDDDLSLGKEFLLEVSKRAKFPILSSNIFDEASMSPLFQPYVIKDINGLKIGIFSLLSPETLLGSSNPRRKGIVIMSPAETAQNVIKELKSKVDWIILLSHLGYPKDVDIAQSIPGIHVIVGGHTGVNLTNPPTFGNTLIVQTASKGMYGARVDLNLSDNKAGFYNRTTKSSMENNLKNLQQRLTMGKAPEAEKDQWRRDKESIIKALEQLESKNQFTFSLSTLNEGTKDHPEIKGMVEAYKARFKREEKPDSPRPPLGKH